MWSMRLSDDALNDLGLIVGARGKYKQLVFSFAGGGFSRLDLSGLDLRGVDLTGAALRQTTLASANLSHSLPCNKRVVHRLYRQDVI